MMRPRTEFLFLDQCLKNGAGFLINCRIQENHQGRTFYLSRELRHKLMGFQNLGDT